MMHSVTAFASFLLAATGVFAAPAKLDKTTTVILSNQAIELGSQTTFKNVLSRREKSPVGSSGPFETIEISLGEDFQNPDLRCQALDANGNPLIAVRGENTDISFSDADKGPWTFQTPSYVSSIICDPAFVAADPEDLEVRVILSNQAIELGTQTVLPNGNERQVSRPTGSGGPFETVEISLGALVDPELRCKLLDANNTAIVATRGENIDITFSDADKGAWTFEQDKKVSKIICDPAFVAASQ